MAGSFFSSLLYSSYIAYDKPSYLLDDFSIFYLCSRSNSLLYSPAWYPDSNKALQLVGSGTSYIPVIVTSHVSPYLSSSPVVLSSPS
jgi:hypothetical protein